jgi:hypothetical protein
LPLAGRVPGRCRPHAMARAPSCACRRGCAATASLASARAPHRRRLRAMPRIVRACSVFQNRQVWKRPLTGLAVRLGLEQPLLPLHPTACRPSAL